MWGGGVPGGSGVHRHVHPTKRAEPEVFINPLVLIIKKDTRGDTFRKSTGNQLGGGLVRPSQEGGFHSSWCMYHPSEN